MAHPRDACGAAEGDPYGGPVAAILKFQKYTMEAMYNAVENALKATGSDKTPQDYLQFLCLGKRVAGPMEGPNEGGKAKAGIMSHRHRRFMVRFWLVCVFACWELFARRGCGSGLVMSQVEVAVARCAIHERSHVQVYVHSKLLIVDDDLALVGTLCSTRNCCACAPCDNFCLCPRSLVLLSTRQ